MPKYDLAFVTTGNKGRAHGIETLVFLATLAPGAGGRMNSSYRANIPIEYHDPSYRAWQLRGGDHSYVFHELIYHMSPSYCRELADMIENGESDANFLPHDLRRLAEEMEKAR